MFLMEIPVRCLELCLMAVTLSAVINDQILRTTDHEHLSRCWRSRVEPNPAMESDWAEIGELVYSSPAPIEFKASSQSVVSAEKDRLRISVSRAKDIYSRLCDFKSKYVEFMDDSQIHVLDRYTELSFSSIKSAESFQYFYKSELSKNKFEKLRLIKTGMDLYSESLPVNFSRQFDLVRYGRMSAEDYENSFDSLKKFLVFASNLVDKIVASEQGFGHLSEMRILQKSIKDIAMSLMWQVSRIGEGREPLGYFLSEFEGSVVVLESQSAEAKAIQRMQEPSEDVDWITYVEPDEQIDVDDLKSQLRACGYIE